MRNALPGFVYQDTVFTFKILSMLIAAVVHYERAVEAGQGISVFIGRYKWVSRIRQRSSRSHPVVIDKALPAVAPIVGAIIKPHQLVEQRDARAGGRLHLIAGLHFKAHSLVAVIVGVEQEDDIVCNTLTRCAALYVVVMKR